MKIGIVGFASTGKTTVFQWLTGNEPDPAASQRGQLGTAELPDERLAWFTEHFSPKKSTPAKIEFIDMPGLHPSERRDNPRRLALIREAGGLLVVLSGFSGGNLADELRRFREECLFADLEIVTNRIAKLEPQLKKAKPAKEKEADAAELAVMQRIQKGLEDGTAGSIKLTPEEEKSIRSFQLLCFKPELVLVNIGDDLIGKPLPADLLALSPKAMAAPTKLELELAELSAEDREAFMKDLGLTGSAHAAILRGIFYGMGMEVFYTVGEDECRAWGVPKGSDAVVCAGQIHTDLARGFVRASVIGYDDYRKAGSLKEAKAKGILRLEGKTYIVKDGEVMEVLHSS